MSNAQGEITSAQIAERLATGLKEIQRDTSDPHQNQARQVGETMRVIIDRLTASDAPTEVLADVNDRLTEVSALLDGYGSQRRRGGEPERADLGHDRAFFEWSPQLGLCSPLAPPIHLEVEGDTLVGRATFGIAYEGPPGCVHGGFVAAAFDEILGLVQSLSGQVGMTGTLKVKYRRPTPLNTELRFVARVTGVSGRKITTSVQVFAGESLTAEADGLFVTVSPERFSAMASHRDRP